MILVNYPVATRVIYQPIVQRRDHLCYLLRYQAHFLLMVQRLCLVRCQAHCQQLVQHRFPVINQVAVQLMNRLLHQVNCQVLARHLFQVTNLPIFQLKYLARNQVCYQHQDRRDRLLKHLAIVQVRYPVLFPLPVRHRFQVNYQARALPQTHQLYQVRSRALFRHPARPICQAWNPVHFPPLAPARSLVLYRRLVRHRRQLNYRAKYHPAAHHLIHL